MKAYIGTKIVQAEPMGELEFNDRHRPYSGGFEASTTAGGRRGYKVVYEDGYVSWSPADVFERSYREVTPAERLLVVPYDD